MLACALPVLFLVAPAEARKHKRAPGVALDTGYISALAAADRFLTAWQNNDLETGVLLLTDRARHQKSDLAMTDFFRGDGMRSFEIALGYRVRTGRYAYPVALVTATQDGRRVRRRTSELVMAGTASGEWAVDKLP